MSGLKDLQKSLDDNDDMAEDQRPMEEEMGPQVGVDEVADLRALRRQVIDQLLADETLAPRVAESFISLLVIWARRDGPLYLRDADEATILPQLVALYGIRLFEGSENHLKERAKPSLDKVSSLWPVRSGDQLSPELLALVPNGESGSREAGGDNNTVRDRTFLPRLPPPEEFSGPSGGDRLSALRTVSKWLESIHALCQLSNLSEEKVVLFAAQLLRGPALLWWTSWSEAPSCTTWSLFRIGLTTRFVGNDPFGLLCSHLEGLRLSKFSRYESFKASFVQTVASMREYAPEGRMWPDMVLVDKLLIALRGSMYYEGVVLDPRTGARPSSFAEAIVLMEAQHDLLLNRDQALGQKSNSEVPETSAMAERRKTTDRRKGDWKGKGNFRGKDGKSSSQGDAGKQADKGKGKRPTNAPEDGGKGKKQKPLDEHYAQKFGISREVAAARVAAGECAKCGKTGHNWKSCGSN